jgi:hypothetical protein
VQEQQVIGNVSPIVYISFPFELEEKVKQLFARYGQWDGKRVQSSAESWVLEFSLLENAFRYCVDCAKQISAHYACLRLNDPQPPFRVAIHLVEPGAENLSWGLEKCHLLLRCMSDNRIFFSQEVKTMVDSRLLTNQFRVQSVGVYDFQIYKNQEVYELLLSTPFG